MKYSIDDLLKSPFEKIKRISEEGYEYWSARDLSKLLEYLENGQNVQNFYPLYYNIAYNNLFHIIL